MPTEQPEPKIELEVKNFGPIAEAKIHLRPLTVFVGPNNTGKSYLATLIYALHDLLLRTVEDGKEATSRFFDQLGSLVDESELDEIAYWVRKELMRSSKEEASSVHTPPQSFSDAVYKALSGNNEAATVVVRHIAKCIGVVEQSDQLIRHGASEGAEVALMSSIPDPDNASRTLEYRLFVSEWGYQLEDMLSPNVDPPITIRPLFESRFPQASEIRKVLQIPTNAELRRSEAYERVRKSANEMLTLHFGRLNSRAYYLPADRTGVMHAHDVVVDAMIQSAQYAGLQDSRDRAQMTGLLADFLRALLIDLGRYDPQESKVAGDIEERILSGEVNRRLTGAGHPRFAYRPKDWIEELPLTRVSSMVSELAPLVLFLKHLVEPGETLIIDEPESHLHPEAQAELANQLAKLVKEGVRVVITTHSGWIVDQFANLVRMSELQPENRSDLPGNDALLVPQDVGVWLFEETSSGSGSTVKEINFDPDGVGYEPGYFGIADKQYNTWAEINNRLADAARRV